MKPRLILALVVFIAACAVFWVLYEQRETRRIPSPAPQIDSKTTPAGGNASSTPLVGSAPSTAGVPAQVAPPTASAASSASVPTGATNFAANKSEVELEQVQTMVRDYRLRLGENPVGTNDEITKALAGANSKGVRFLPVEGARLNTKGELVDPWGTPYFFHQVSRSEMEIRSAGPDRKMWTPDDRSAQ